MIDEENRQRILLELDTVISSKTGREMLRLWRGPLFVETARATDDKDLRGAAKAITDLNIDEIYKYLACLLILCEQELRKHDNDSFLDLPFRRIMDISNDSGIDLGAVAGTLEMVDEMGYKIK